MYESARVEHIGVSPADRQIVRVLKKKFLTSITESTWNLACDVNGDQRRDAVAAPSAEPAQWRDLYANSMREESNMDDVMF